MHSMSLSMSLAWRCAQLKLQIAKRARPWRHVVCIAPTLAQQTLVRGNDMTSMEWCQIQAFLKHTHSPWFIWSAWVLSSHLSTTWPCCKLNCLSGTPEYAADRSENQAPITCSWSENSRFSWRRPLSSKLMNRVLIPIFGSKTIWSLRNATTCSSEMQKGYELQDASNLP